jgi:pyruvate formate lyase activating enzyme
VALRGHGILVVLQTTGAFRWAAFEALVYPHLDLIHYDLKLFDPVAHATFCGADNAVILDNFRTLSARAAQGGVALLARVPLVPDITDTDDNLHALSVFVGEHASQVQLLPYNPLWPGKARQIGATPDPRLEGASWQSAEALERCAAPFRRAGLEVIC